MSYGVPDEGDHEAQAMQWEYAAKLAKWAARWDAKKVVNWYLYGGATNRRRPDVTEAEYFRPVLEAAFERQFGETREFRVMNYPLTPRDARSAMRVFGAQMGQQQTQLSERELQARRMFVMCEARRFGRVEHLAHYTLGDEVEVVPIKFDHREYRRRDYAMRGIEYTSAWLGTHMPGFVRVERGLREMKLRFL